MTAQPLAETAPPSTLLLLSLGSWEPDDVTAGLLLAERVEFRRVSAVSALDPDTRPTVLVLDRAGLDALGTGRLATLVDRGLAVVMVGDPSDVDVPDDLPAHLLSGYLTPPVGARRMLIALKCAFRETAARRDARHARNESFDRTSEVADLTETGIQLLTERDHNRLLQIVVAQARRVTQADAASLYLVESDERGGSRLEFKLSQNDSRPDIQLQQFCVPLDDSSLAGYAARTGQLLAIRDVYALPDDLPYHFNRNFDQASGYRTRSVLVIPMENHTGDVIGVLQLINRKPPGVATFKSPDDVVRRALPFDDRAISLARSLAGQAAVSIENARLHSSIERLFDGFVRASVMAVEQRDPTTAGHSERVASMTCQLAEAVDRVADGPFAPVRFSRAQLRELRYAGLLHDFGKVSVRECVLVKAQKLYPDALAAVQARHDFLLRTAEWRFERDRAAWLEQHGTAGYDEQMRTLRARLTEERDRLSRFLLTVKRANRPTILPAGNFAALDEFARATYSSLDGSIVPFLTSDEVRALSIRQGTLDDDEWVEMRRHVSHTYDFLRNIPWTSDLRSVPNIALGHHEKLDGSGYPRGLVGAEIPIQTRMMTIADIFDALTAADRPYKKAVSVPHALEVLEADVTAGRLDADLFQVFIDAGIHRHGGAIRHDDPSRAWMQC